MPTAARLCIKSRNMKRPVVVKEEAALIFKLNRIAIVYFCVRGTVVTSGLPRNFVRGGVSTNSIEDRGQIEWGSGGGSPLVMCSGGSCNLVQEVSFHKVKFS